MRRTSSRSWALLRDAWSRFTASGDTLSAATAFYALLSIAPLIVIVVDLTALVFDDADARASILSGLNRAANPDVARVVKRMIDASVIHANGALASVVATALALVAASRLFVQIQVSLNAIWGVRAAPTEGLIDYLRHYALKRALSLAMVLVCGGLLLIDLAIKAAFSGLGSLAARWLGAATLPASIGFAQQSALSLALLWSLFAMIYRVLPDARVRFADAAFGAALTVLLTLPGTWLLGLYFAHVAPTWLQGAVGSAAVFILWTYYLAQVFFMGAAFTRAWSCRSGAAVEPEEHAQLAANAASDGRGGLTQ